MLIGRTTIMLEMSPLFLFEGQLPRHSVMNLEKATLAVVLGGFCLIVALNVACAASTIVLKTTF